MASNNVAPDTRMSAGGDNMRSGEVRNATDSSLAVAKASSDSHEMSSMDSSTAAMYDPKSSSSKRIVTETTTTTVTTTKTDNDKLLADTYYLQPARQQQQQQQQQSENVARVEHLGRTADTCSYNGSNQQQLRAPYNQKTSIIENVSRTKEQEEAAKRLVDKKATTIGTIAAQSSQCRIVIALLRDGDRLELKVQEMKPGFFDVGANLAECGRCCDEHRKLMQNLHKHRQAPIEDWLNRYKQIRAQEKNMSDGMKSVYLCMGDNLQACWRSLWRQLELKAQLLDETYKFYEQVQNLNKTIESAEQHVQIYRKEFLDGKNTLKFNQASKELRQLNDRVAMQYKDAKQRQQSLVASIGRLATSNLDDARQNYLISDAQNLINHISNYLMPLERRKIQLESVTTTVSNTTNTTTFDKLTRRDSITSNRSVRQLQQSKVYENGKSNGVQNDRPNVGMIREISNFNDLDLVDNWLNSKIEQLNSSLLSSLGVSVTDSRSILTKHEQIALECSAIEEATLQFNGKNIHALKSGTNIDERNNISRDNKSLFEAQKASANRVRDVITILSARIVLLRRTIDFYTRAKDATDDIGKMMRRLQVDNSLQSVQYVANELELKDVSSVIASGATIISELQQLQLAQKHGQRPSIVGLNLITNGIRAIIDQLSQDLSHLKTVLNQRRLILLNEDAAKKANNFTTKCQQLKNWLNSQAKSYLLSNNRVGTDPAQVRAYCEGHEKLRCALQNKTLEVEALLRLLSTLMESFDAKSRTADDIQRETDELRQDWINVTNCLDKRLELAKKYLAILNTVGMLDKELISLDDLYTVENGSRPKTPERTDDDIKSNIEQSWAQLSNLVRNFAIDAQKSNTALVYPQSLNAKPVVDDIDKQDLVDDANNWLVRIEQRRKAGPSNQRVKREAEVQNSDAAPLPPGAPRFIKGLTSREIEPFHTVVLECETDPNQQCRVEWFMNNFKRIPANIRHSILSQGSKHKLTINSFNSICCGKYMARATNEVGQALTQCRLRLAGIKEANNGDEGDEEKLNGAVEGTIPASNSADTELNAQKPTQASQYNESSMRRIIQSVGQQRDSDSPQVFDSQRESNKLKPSSHQYQYTTKWQQQNGPRTNSKPNSNTSRTSQQIVTTSDSESILTPADTPMNMPVVESKYSGNINSNNNNWRNQTKTTTTTTTTKTTTNQHQQDTNHLRVPSQGGYYVESPSSSASFSKSTSQSPLVGPPQAPAFVEGLTERCGSRSGLMCVVIGNPPPTIEWLHNDVPIAKTKCQKPSAINSGSSVNGPQGNICKLTIATTSNKSNNNNNTGGQYECRATNRFGQTSSRTTIAK